MRLPNATARLPINSSGSGGLALKSPESARNDANRHWPVASAVVIWGSGDRPERHIERFGPISWPISWPGNGPEGPIEISAQPAT